LRRAQGIDGGLAASRAAYIGGCAATSNLLAGKFFGIPVRGTHAHSWVMAFDNERLAFESYAKAMPNNCIFLVDTYDTFEGVRAAIEVGQQLRAVGQRLAGVRLDSGDLAYLSVRVREMLDEAGFGDTAILASNDLDEQIIASLKSQDAAITVWGVGTRLVTGYDQPALGGVYKLACLQSPDGSWVHKVKVSEQAVKTSTPGILQVRRFRKNSDAIADMIYDELTVPSEPAVMVDPIDLTRRRTMTKSEEYEDLLIPIFRGGQLVYDAPKLEATRERTQRQLAMFHAGVLRREHPHQYPVGLEKGLYDLKTELILGTRQRLV
jgi:nicotinate phosphoribosyltransferase